MCEALIKSIEVNQKKGGFTVLDVPSNKLINTLASFFKEKNLIKPPKYTPIVKCCHANDCEPVDQIIYIIKQQQFVEDYTLQKVKH